VFRRYFHVSLSSPPLTGSTIWRSLSEKSLFCHVSCSFFVHAFFNGICRSHANSFTRGEYNLVWIFFTSQSTLILVPKIMLNLKIVCDTLNIIFGVAPQSLIIIPCSMALQLSEDPPPFSQLGSSHVHCALMYTPVFFFH
jgi:hypothetical protein